MTPLNLDPWWDEPAYKAASTTFPERVTKPITTMVVPPDGNEGGWASRWVVPIRGRIRVVAR